MITTKDIIRIKLREYDSYMRQSEEFRKKAEMVLDSVKRMCDPSDKPPKKYIVTTMAPGICKKGGTKHLAYYPEEKKNKWRCDDPSCHRTSCEFFWRRKCDECLGVK